MDVVNVIALYVTGYCCWESLPMDWRGLIGKMFAEKWCGKDRERSDHHAPFGSSGSGSQWK